MTDSLICKHCKESLAACECAPCRWCKRALHVCHELVDERFPAEARDAYAKSGRTTAPKCDTGQQADMGFLGGQPSIGWSIDRAVSHPEWRGDHPEGVRVEWGFGRRPRRPLRRDPAETGEARQP